MECAGILEAGSVYGYNSWACSTKALQQAAAGEMVLSEALTPVLAASLRANRATSDRDALSAMLGWVEVALASVYFFSALAYLRPYKKAAKTLARQVIEKASDKAPR